MEIRLRKYLWPQIPDPAKSNLALWVPHKMGQDFPAPPPEKRSSGYLGLTVSDLFRVLPPEEEDPDPKTLAGNELRAEIPRTGRKYPQLTPVAGKRTLPWEHGGLTQKLPETWSEVEYARVVIIQKNSSPKESQLCRNGSLPKGEAPPGCCPEPKFGQGVWLQNLTYKALVDPGSHNRALEVTGKFPVLVSLAAAVGNLQASGNPQGAPRKNP
uniref:Uncharacterized protein n=1 Tax=Sphaerodactylus townsendi TaxID=933632 RepID=A0ACB8F136_9SAUR